MDRKQQELDELRLARGPAGPHKRRVLLVLGDESSIGPLLHLVTCDAASDTGLEVVLLAVQPKPETVRSRAIMIETVRRNSEAVARQRLRPFDEALTAAGIAHSVRIEIADEPEAVLRGAREEQCSLIVMAAKPLTGARRRWQQLTALGPHSAASRVVDLAEMPVLVLGGGVH